MRLYVTDKELDHILRKMFRVVGAKFESIRKSCGESNWFTKHHWTEQQERDFRKWFKEYLVKKLKMPPKIADKKVSMFLFMHGWTYKEGE